MGKVYTRFQTKPAQKPYPMGRHIPQYGSYKVVSPPSEGYTLFQVFKLWGWRKKMWVGNWNCLIFLIHRTWNNVFIISVNPEHFSYTQMTQPANTTALDLTRGCKSSTGTIYHRNNSGTSPRRLETQHEQRKIGSLRACLHGDGGPQVGEVTLLGRVTLRRRQREPHKAIG